MGAGLAKQAANRFPDLPLRAGQMLRQLPRARLLFFPDYQLIHFPTKRSWREFSDLSLIATLLPALKQFVDEQKIENVYLPALGCGLGGLSWFRVKTFLEKELDDRFTVVHLR